MMDCFNGLREINAHRDISKYERLSETHSYNEFIKCVKHICIYYFSTSTPENVIYTELSPKIEKLAGSALTPENLVSLVQDMELRSFCNSKHKKNVFGITTGVLLDVLTSKRRLLGLKTVIEIDGGGTEFDKLFWGAKNIDRLFVKNFNGASICGNIGSGSGKIELVSVSSCTGPNILKNAGAGKSDGLHGLVMAADIQGDSVLENASNFLNVIGYKIKGNKALYCVGGKNKNIERLIAIDIEGSEALNMAGGRISNLAVLNVNGENALRLPYGNIDRMVCDNVKGFGALAGIVFPEVNVTKLFYRETPMLNGTDFAISYDDNPEGYETIANAAKIYDIKMMLASMFG